MGAVQMLISVRPNLRTPFLRSWLC